MKSIRSSLLVWLIAPLTLVAAIVALETFYASQKTSNELHDRTLFAVMLTISENILANDSDALAEPFLEVLTDNLGDQFFYHVAGPNNAFITGYAGRPDLPAGTKVVSGRPTYYDGVHQGDPVRVVAIRQLMTKGIINGWATITVWQRISQRTDLTLSLFARSLLRLVLLTCLAGVIVWFAVSKGLRPIQTLREAINRRSPTDLTPIKREMPSELHGIVGSMNDLLTRVARSKANRERFIGDAAHQLRNPIAAVKTQAETALKTNDQDQMRMGLEHIAETSTQTGHMIEQMLLSARTNALEFDLDEDLDLNEMVADTAREMAPLALARNQVLTFDAATAPPPVKGQKVLLREAIVNLIDNAIRHSPKNTDIGVATRSENGTTSICIRDEGEAFDEEDLSRLTQPFSTGNASSAGSGLGLSIAKDVAKAHGGNIFVQAEDHGKTVIMKLPAPGP